MYIYCECVPLKRVYVPNQNRFGGPRHHVFVAGFFFFLHALGAKTWLTYTSNTYHSVYKASNRVCAP